MKSTVSWVYEDLKFKISEGYNQNWSEPSEIFNLRFSTTPETVAFRPYLDTKLGETPNVCTYFEII